MEIIHGYSTNNTAQFDGHHDNNSSNNKNNKNNNPKLKIDRAETLMIIMILLENIYLNS